MTISWCVPFLPQKFSYSPILPVNSLWTTRTQGVYFTPCKNRHFKMGLTRMELLLEVLELTSDKVDQKLGGTAGMKALIACGRSGEPGVSRCDILSLCGPSSHTNWGVGSRAVPSAAPASVQKPLQQHQSSVSTCPAKMGCHCWAAL